MSSGRAFDERIHKLINEGKYLNMYYDSLGTQDIFLVPTEEGRDEAQDKVSYSKYSISYALSEMLEDYISDMGWWFVPPEDIGGMTEAPIISDEGYVADDGTWKPVDRDSRVWAHTDYAIEDPIEEWAMNMPVRFKMFGTKHSAKPVVARSKGAPRTEYERLRDFFFGKPGSRKARGLTGLPSWRRR